MAAGATAEITPLHRDPTPQSGTPRVSVFLLRPFEVAIDETPIEKWPSQKAKTVFKLLLLAYGRAMPKEELIELVWPDIDPKAGRNNLNVAICHLRRTLAQGGMTDPFVTVQNNTCQLERGLAIWTDAAAFEQHARRAQAYVRANQTLLAVGEFAACVALYQNELLAKIDMKRGSRRTAKVYAIDTWKRSITSRATISKREITSLAARHARNCSASIPAMRLRIEP